MKQLPQNYEAAATEKKWQDVWLKSGVYNWDANSTATQYVIDTPPPTISGQLHMGHIFSYTQTDFIARFRRMRGENVFYPMGFDDNGLPTERLVEKEHKTKASILGREKFIELCDTAVEKYRIEFRELFQAVALSVDWNQEYHTISEDVRKISQMSFLDLLAKKQVSRKLAPMFWDPVDQTAIAQAEVEDKEFDSFENYIYFGLIDENADPAKTKWEDLEKVEIMTTRPELLISCVALMVHPDDATKYAGKKAVTPLFNVIVPIVADEAVQKDKGTGVVMCCTFGDETDISWWKQHKLNLRVSLNKYGKIEHNISDDEISFLNEDESSKITNKNCLNISAAKEILSQIQTMRADHQDKKLSAKHKMIELLEANNLTAKEKKAIKHSVKCAERSGAPLEIIPTQQWFVHVLEHKEALKQKAAECVWRPAHMQKRAEQWIDSLSWDWCISRQRYFGIPFPVWYSKRAGEEGKIIIPSVDKLPINPLVDLPEGYSADEVTPEVDVMDTWATSSVSPQINSHAINEKYATDIARHKKLFPADLRPQAHEIIRTWAFYTIAKSYLHENTIPWKNLMISGWCLAEDKTKMSKSKGNVVTPQEVLVENSADVIRYWSSTSRLGADTAFSRDVLKIGKKLVNKIWNATKFAAINLDALTQNPTTVKADIESGVICESLDKWIVSRISDVVVKATKHFEDYEYSLARNEVEEFFWKDFCDNYLEAVKARTYDEGEENAASRQSALCAIYHVIKTLLKLFAPFTPHICEELYSHIFDKDYENSGSVHAKGSWPVAAEFKHNSSDELAGVLLISILDEVRRVKAEAKVSVKFPIKNLNISAVNSDIIKSFLNDLKAVTSAENINISDGAELKISVELGEAVAA